MKKMKSKILEQDRELKELNEKMNSLEKKERKYHFIYKKEQELYQAYDEIQKLSPESLLKKPIVSILDKDFQTLDEI